MQPMSTPRADGFCGVAKLLLDEHRSIPKPRTVNMRIARIVNPGGNCGTHACFAGHYLLAHLARYSGVMWNEHGSSGNYVSDLAP